MQMSFRKKINMEKILPYLYESIKQEQDYFVIGIIMVTIQKLTGKKFALSQKAVDNIDIEKINISKIKIIRYFEKLYK
jgi:hypothetical protein